MIASQKQRFKHRIIVGSISVIILFVCIYLSHLTLFMPLFAAVIAGSIALALWEFYRLAEAKGFSPLSRLGITMGALYAMGIFATSFTPASIPLASTMLVLSILLAFFYYFYDDENPLEDIAITLFGLSYLAIPLSTVLLITYYFPIPSENDGRWWLLYALMIPKMTDSGGYFIGKATGTRLLAPVISPKKTIEGALGGLVIAIATSVALPEIAYTIMETQVLPIPLFDRILLGAVIGVAAQVGDLGESLLKRDAGIKDSNDLPGLGGMLDMVDSLVFTVPVIYLYLLVRY